MTRITLESPAKLNFYLKVVNKRPDGYHNLINLFQRIDLHDDIRFSSNKTGKITILCNDPQVPTGPKNLIYKVAKLLQQEHGITQGVDFKINKRIPVAAGLAGGSSNAATALMGLNKLWKIGLKQSKLLQYGSQIGSDVPFFLHDCSWALGTERGDKLKRLNIEPKYWHILIVPRMKMYSGEVFTHLNLQLTNKGDDVNILIRSLKKYNILKAKEQIFNDLESSILKICPNLLNIKKRLQQNNAGGVIFSGSGPSVFGLTTSKKEAESLKTIFSRRYSKVFVVKTR